MRKIWLCLLLLALLGTLLSGCMRRGEAQGYDVYYVEQSAGAASALVPEKHPLPAAPLWRGWSICSSPAPSGRT